MILALKLSCNLHSRDNGGVSDQSCDAPVGVNFCNSVESQEHNQTGNCSTPTRFMNIIILDIIIERH